VRDVVDHGIAERTQNRKRAHVDDEVVIAEAEPALGDDHARVAGGRHFRDGVPHVLGREELSLLDIDDAPVARAATSRSVCRERNAGI
jgi:hypothetical protein